MSYDVNVTPCPSGRFGYGRDMGSYSGKFYAVWCWNSDERIWVAISHFSAESTAKSEAMRMDARKQDGSEGR